MDKEINKLWDYLTDYEIETDKEICLVTSINGTNLDSQILYLLIFINIT